jgi:hypothetical protein
VPLSTGSFFFKVELYIYKNFADADGGTAVGAFNQATLVTHDILCSSGACLTFCSRHARHANARGVAKVPGEAGLRICAIRHLFPLQQQYFIRDNILSFILCNIIYDYECSYIFIDISLLRAPVLL